MRAQDYGSMQKKIYILLGVPSKKNGGGDEKVYEWCVSEYSFLWIESVKKKMLARIHKEEVRLRKVAVIELQRKVLSIP